MKCSTTIFVSPFSSTHVNVFLIKVHHFMQRSNLLYGFDQIIISSDLREAAFIRLSAYEEEPYLLPRGREKESFCGI